MSHQCPLTNRIEYKVNMEQEGEEKSSSITESEPARKVSFNYFNYGMDFKASWASCTGWFSSLAGSFFILSAQLIGIAFSLKAKGGKGSTASSND